MSVIWTEHFMVLVHTFEQKCLLIGVISYALHCTSQAYNRELPEDCICASLETVGALMLK